MGDIQSGDLDWFYVSIWQEREYYTRARMLSTVKALAMTCQPEISDDFELLWCINNRIWDEHIAKRHKRNEDVLRF